MDVLKTIHKKDKRERERKRERARDRERERENLKRVGAVIERKSRRKAIEIDTMRVKEISMKNNGKKIIKAKYKKGIIFATRKL